MKSKQIIPNRLTAERRTTLLWQKRLSKCPSVGHSLKTDYSDLACHPQSHPIQPAAPHPPWHLRAMRQIKTAPLKFSIYHPNVVRQHCRSPVTLSGAERSITEPSRVSRLRQIKTGSHWRGRRGLHSLPVSLSLSLSLSPAAEEGRKNEIHSAQYIIIHITYDEQEIPSLNYF